MYVSTHTNLILYMDVTQICFGFVCMESHSIKMRLRTDLVEIRKLSYASDREGVVSK